MSKRVCCTELYTLRARSEAMAKVHRKMPDHILRVGQEHEGIQ